MEILCNWNHQINFFFLEHLCIWPARDLLAALHVVLVSLSLHVGHCRHQILQEVKLLLQFNALLSANTQTHTHWQMKWSNNRSHVMDVTYKCDVVMVLALRDWVTWQAFVRRDSRNSSRARAQLTVKERADMRRPNDNQTAQISALLRKIMF